MQNLSDLEQRKISSRKRERRSSSPPVSATDRPGDGEGGLGYTISRLHKHPSQMSTHAKSYRPRMHASDGRLQQQETPSMAFSAAAGASPAMAAARAARGGATAAAAGAADGASQVSPQNEPTGNLGSVLAYTMPRTRLRSLGDKTNSAGSGDVYTVGGEDGDGCGQRRVPFFRLGELWESFEEWSCYGVGVPIETGRGAHVTQYYVPYLSGIQLFARHEQWSPCESRFSSDTSESDMVDSSSDSSDTSDRQPSQVPEDWQAVGVPECQEMALPEGEEEEEDEEQEEAGTGRGVEKERQMVRGAMDRLEGSGGYGDPHDLGQGSTHRGDGQGTRCLECGGGELCYQYFEEERPHLRPPLHSKVEELRVDNEVLTSIRSTDLHPASWLAVAWYPSYTIPMSLSRADLSASFLTFHSLTSTPLSSKPETCSSCHREVAPTALPTREGTVAAVAPAGGGSQKQDWMWKLQTAVVAGPGASQGCSAAAAEGTMDESYRQRRHVENVLLEQEEERCVESEGERGGVEDEEGKEWEEGEQEEREVVLRPFGFCAYRAWGPLWADRLQVEGLTEAANAWVKQMRVAHPDFNFFSGRQRF